MKSKFKVKFNSPVILIYLTACFIATLLGTITAGRSTDLFFSVYRSSMSDPLTYFRFFTHVLGHGGWEHFIGNASFLLLLGPMLEDKYGKWKITEAILAVALASGIINFTFFPSISLCGASGVVFAFILLTSFTGFKEGEIPVTFLLVAFIYIGKQVYEGIAVRDNISNMAHIVGGIVGAVFGYYLNKRNP